MLSQPKGILRRSRFREVNSRKDLGWTQNERGFQHIGNTNDLRNYVAPLLHAGIQGGRTVMKQMIIAVSLLLAFGVGCDEGQDRQLPDGTKLFGARTLNNGTHHDERIELLDGEKQFDATMLPDGTSTAGRVELPNGKKWFDVTKLPDGTTNARRVELPNGEKDFDETMLPDGTVIVGRVEFPNGKKLFDVTMLPDGTVKAR